MATSQKRTIERGIRQDNTGFEVRASKFGQYKTKRFPANTPLQTMRKWRERQQRVMNLQAGRHNLTPIQLPRAIKDCVGYCYIYFALCDGRVKIGRASDVKRRFTEMKTFMAEPPQLLAATVAHVSLEQLIQQRFRADLVGGEWYTMSGALEDFIAAVRTGCNPAALLME